MEVRVNSFDPRFQQEALSIALKDNNFLSTLHALVYSRKKRKKRFKIDIFSADQLNKIADCLFSAFEKNENTLPTLGSVQNEIKKRHQDESESLCEMCDRIYDIKLENDTYHKTSIAEFIKGVELIDLRNDIDSAISRGFNKVVDMSNAIKERMERIEKISFKASPIIDFTNPFEIIHKSAMASSNAIKIGIEPFDNVASNGLGFTRQNTLLVFGTSNDGKSMMFSVEASVNMAKMGHRVLVINLEGETYLLPIRIISCLTGITLNKLDRYGEIVGDKVSVDSFKDFFTKEEYEAISGANEVLERIKIIHASSSKDASYVEYLVSQASELYNEWPFDVIVTDYTGIARSKKNFRTTLEENIFCFKEFDRFATTHNTLHLAIAQANRDGMKEQKGVSDNQKDLPVLREFHLGGAINLFQDSGYSISISSTSEEKLRGVRRLTLLKNRKGMTNVTISVKGEWGSARPLTGKIEVLSGDYEDEKTFGSKSKGNGLDLITDNDEVPVAVEDIFTNLNIEFLKPHMNTVIKFQKLKSDLKNLKYKLLEIERGDDGGEEKQEEYKKTQKYISDIEQQLGEFSLDPSLEQYFREELLPNRTEIRELCLEKKNEIMKNDSAKKVLGFLTASFSDNSIFNSLQKSVNRAA